ncbi:hypothetical protein [Ferrimonas futtsuensis]|uniref:hypothetical protein n=1 Tax=Ferrimonas futtsuensis TaxID=364764 RepID=UPI00040BFA33|nr:hypothetical protein [Ferrimonas futtsuensis]
MSLPAPGAATSQAPTNNIATTLAHPWRIIGQWVSIGDALLTQTYDLQQRLNRADNHL